MTRIAAIAPDRWNEAQRRMHARVAATGRGAAAGPWAVLMHAPEAGERLSAVVEYMMSENRVAHRLKRLAVIIVARAYTAQFEWATHVPRARSAGIAEEVIEAIRNRRRPSFTDPDEELVYDVATEILEKKRIGDALYGRAAQALGEPALVELIAIIGFYIGVAVLLVAFEVDPPGNGVPPLAPQRPDPISFP